MCLLLGAAAWACASANPQASKGTAPAGADAAAGDASAPGDGSAQDASVMTGGHPPGTDAGSGGPSAEAGTAEAGAPTATIHFLGRFDTRDPAGPRFAWSGSAIAATFRGTGIQATLTDTGTNYFAVVIDDGAPTIIPTSGSNKTYTLASKLPVGSHTLVLTKRTEANVGVVQLLSLVPQGGALIASPAPFTRRIEYVGDSITCGYGDLGVGPSCKFTADTEDETVAYGALTAAQLDAQQMVVAYSGKGMYRNIDGSTKDTMPVLFERTLADDATSVWSFATPPPDVVVINLSTNDFGKGDPGTAFQAAYVAFLRQLRSHYASALIVCTTSPMLDGASRTASIGYIQGAVQRVRAAGDSKVSLVSVPNDGGTLPVFDVQQATNGYGCDYHPSAKTHGIMAAVLVPALRGLTGF